MNDKFIGYGSTMSPLKIITTKTITENRKEFIKNNNIIVKFNDFEELRDVLDILENTSFPFYKQHMDWKYGYVLNMPRNKHCIVMETFNLEYLKKHYDSEDIVIHEFPTKNFINAFN